MKKLMIVAVLALVGLGSCKKDEEVKPQGSDKVSVELTEKKDLGVWD